VIEIGHGGAAVCQDNTRSRTRRADGGGRQVLERKKENRENQNQWRWNQRNGKKKHLNRTYNTLNLMEKKEGKARTNCDTQAADKDAHRQEAITI
jgi:hypothetical protein